MIIEEYEEEQVEEDKETQFDQEQYLRNLDDFCIVNCNACPKCDNN